MANGGDLKQITAEQVWKQTNEMVEQKIENADADKIENMYLVKRTEFNYNAV